MVNKITKWITNDFGLKILAVVFASVLWLAVVNIDDPKITRSFTATVSVENADYLAGIGKCYEIVNNSNTVSFKVTGKRSYLERMSNADFKAVADLETIEEMSRVPIEISPQRYSGNVTIASKVYYLELAVEDMVSLPFVIGVNTQGEVAEDKALGDTTVSPTLLRVSGPESVVEIIDTVTANVNVEGMSADMTDSVIPTLYDKDGNEIDRSELTFNVQNVMVSVQILDTKDVTLNFQTTGTLAEGYEYVGIEYNPQTVKIKGVSSVLNTINSITVPPEVLDLTGAAGNLKKEVDVSAYLPEGVDLVDHAQAQISVVVNVAQHERRVFEVPTANITVTNLAKRYEVEFLKDSVKVEIEGQTAALDELDASTLTGNIDVSGMTLGEHTVTLQLNLDERFKQTKAVTVTIDIALTETGNDNSTGNREELEDIVNNNNNENTNASENDADTNDEQEDTEASENQNSSTTMEE
ncbi:MAG: hypothetical protein J6A75_09295 [Lachnospiraceae bacterium]|nr:hypothetical protein [Lachnospiraceae bacterium]